MWLQLGPSGLWRVWLVAITLDPWHWFNNKSAGIKDFTPLIFHEAFLLLWLMTQTLNHQVGQLMQGHLQWEGGDLDLPSRTVLAWLLSLLPVFFSNIHFGSLPDNSQEIFFCWNPSAIIPQALANSCSILIFPCSSPFLTWNPFLCSLMTSAPTT